MRVKELYTTPVTFKKRIELEDALCASVITTEPKTGYIKTTGHEIEKISFENAEWNDGKWE